MAPELHLTNQPLWPLYKKLRRHVARSIANGGIPPGTEAVDQALAAGLPEILADLQALFEQDVNSRK